VLSLQAETIKHLRDMTNMTTFALINRRYNDLIGKALKQQESQEQRPCVYSHEQMEEALREAEADYQEGRYLSHSSICERYGL
jgi:DUF1680 family protein